MNPYIASRLSARAPAGKGVAHRANERRRLACCLDWK